MFNKSYNTSSSQNLLNTNKKNVIFIAYNSTITGGKALRVLNQIDYTQEMLYKNESKNMVKSYCENYDKAKKK